jgi:6-phosphofructokinase 2
MVRIATLTLNPTIDVAYEVDRVFHTHKMRTRAEIYAPGGGGINVARVLSRLGTTSHCLYLSGGATGPAFDGLMAEHGLSGTRIAISEPTRIAGAVLERESGKEYRFTPLGPKVSAKELEACVDAIARTECDWFVASGSLSPGIPDGFYAQIANMMHARGIPFVLDTSGTALREGLAGGHVLLVKPSLNELSQLCGRELVTKQDISTAACALATDGRAELVAVTMGHDGALLASRNGACFLPTPQVVAASAVGAGDSFLAGMVHALSAKQGPEDALRLGIASGAAAVLAPGTSLALASDITRLRIAMQDIQAVAVPFADLDQ